MTIGSLFSGVGGLELGLEMAGLGPVLWQVENGYEKGSTPQETEKLTERNRAFLHSVLARHWPDADRSVSDVFEAGSHNLARVEIIAGGFPCQPSSLAGHRKGSADERWLWPQFARIVRELRPRIVVAENVPGFTSIDDGEGMREVLGDLAKGGYDAIWLPIRASVVAGAPHERERLFFIGWLREELGDANGSRLAVGQGQRDDDQEERPAAVGASSSIRDVGQAQSSVDQPADGISFGLDVRWPARRGESQYCWEAPRTIEGCAHRKMSLRALGNAVVPQVSYFVGMIVREILRFTHPDLRDSLAMPAVEAARSRL